MKLLISGLILLLIFIPSAFASDTGSVTVGTGGILKSNYLFSGEGGFGVDEITNFYFFNQSYNRIYNWSAIGVDVFSNYNTVSEYTTFNVVSGGTGNGIFYYDSVSEGLYWVCEPSCYITLDEFEVEYGDNNVTHNFSWGNPSTIDTQKATTTTSVNYPIGIKHNKSGIVDGIGAGGGWRGLVYYAIVEAEATVSYNVTYVGDDGFTALTIKSPGITTKVKYEDFNRSIYFQQPAYDNLTWFAFSPYINEGIWINVTLSSGTQYWEREQINASGERDDYYIIFNKSSFNLGDVVKVNTSIKSMDGSSAYQLKFQQQIESNLDVYEDFYIINSSTQSFIPIIQRPYDISTITAFIYKNGVVVNVNSTTYGQAENITQIYGNISLNKTQFARNENVNISYNLSVNGFIRVTCGPDIEGEYDVYNRKGNVLHYVNKLCALPVYVRLYTYFNDSLMLVDYKTYETIESIDSVFFVQSQAYQDSNIEIHYQSTGNAYLVLNDSAGNVKFNYSVSSTAGRTLNIFYYVSKSDLIGRWTVSLISAGTTLANDTIYIYSAAVTPTPGGTVDYVGNPANKRNKENEILNTGYSAVTGLLSLAIIATMMFFLKKMKW